MCAGALILLDVEYDTLLGTRRKRPIDRFAGDPVTVETIVDVKVTVGRVVRTVMVLVWVMVSARLTVTVPPFCVTPGRSLVVTVPPLTAEVTVYVDPTVHEK